MINQDTLKSLDNPRKILYILREKGSLRFEEIVQILNPYEKLSAKEGIGAEESHPKLYASKSKPLRLMSRGTIAKYLKELMNPLRKDIEQVTRVDEKIKRNVVKYILTPRGLTYINNILKKEEGSIRPEQLKKLYSSIIKFFEQRGVEKNLYLPPLIKMISRIDQTKFFQLEQSEELYSTFFYIYQNMLELSIGEGDVRYLGLDLFCETYSVRKSVIIYHLEKILEADLGFYRVPWNHDLFFQANDLIGGVLFTLIRNALESEIVRRSLDLEEIHSFTEMAHEIAQSMVDLQMIKARIENQFMNLVESLIIIQGIERGFTRQEITDYWPLFNDLLKTEKGIEVTKVIFGNQTAFAKMDALGKVIEHRNAITTQNPALENISDPQA